MALPSASIWRNEVVLSVTNRQTSVSAAGEKIYVFPTRVLVELPSYKIVAFGQDARPVEHAGIKQAKVVYPASAYEIFDQEATEIFLRAVMQMVLGKSFLLRPKVYLSQPDNVTPFMQELWQSVLFRAGAREVNTIHPLLSTAVGAGLPVQQPHGYAVGWWQDDSLVFGLLAFGHVQFEKSWSSPVEQERDSLATFFAETWKEFVSQLPSEFRTTVSSEGVVLLIDNDDPLLASAMTREAKTPVVVVPPSSEIFGMKKIVDI